jgi:hypothetical protein
MDYDEILDKIEKYHYLACGNDSCKIISNSDSKGEAKDKLVEIFSPRWDELIGTTIYLVTVRKSTKGSWTKEKHSLLPGPLYIEITEYKIKKGKKIKMHDEGINSNVYFTENYLKKNKKIRIDDIKTLVLKYKNRELKKGVTQKNSI